MWAISNTHTLGKPEEPIKKFEEKKCDEYMVYLTCKKLFGSHVRQCINISGKVPFQPNNVHGSRRYEVHTSVHLVAQDIIFLLVGKSMVSESLVF